MAVRVFVSSLKDCDAEQALRLARWNITWCVDYAFECHEDMHE